MLLKVILSNLVKREKQYIDDRYYVDLITRNFSTFTRITMLGA